MVNKGETQQESRGGDGRREGTRGKKEKTGKDQERCQGRERAGNKEKEEQI